MSDKKLSLLVNFVGVDKMTGLMKNIVGLGRDGSKSIKALSGEAKKLGNQMTSSQKALAASIQSNSGNITELMAKHRALAADIAKVNAQIERQKRLSAIRADTITMQRRGDSLKSSGQDKMLGGVGLATPFILATKAGMDFSSGMVDIQQKAELTNAETDRMAASILSLAKAAHQLPEDMRGGVDALAGLGLDPRKALQMIGPIGRMGTAYKVDLADGANAAFSNLNNLKVPIGQTARALDIMAASGNAGAFEVKDMARWFPSLTAQMQALGQKGTPAVADLAAALQIARRGAGDADQAANNIQNLLTKINSPATVARFKKMGIDVTAQMKAAVAAGKTPMEAIAELTNKATKGDLGKIGYLFEDMQVQAALRSLIQNLDDYRKIRADITNATGTVDNAFAQREARDGTIAWRDFMGSVQRLGITMGASFLPTATRFLNTADGIISRVAAWSQANPQLSGTLVSLLGLLVAARVGLGALQFAFGGLLGPLATGYEIWKKYQLLGSLAAVFPKVAGAIGIARSAFTGLVGVLNLLRYAALANPVIAIATGVAVAAYLIYSNWDRIKAAFFAGVNWIKGAIGALPDWMRSIGSMMMQGLLMALNPALLVAKLIDIARSGIVAFKNYFGIKSPSRLMMEMGGHITSGLSQGIEGDRTGPARSMRRMAAGVAAAGAISLSPIAPMQAAASPAASMGAGGGIVVHINAQPGQDAQAIADEVIRRIEQKQSIATRSAYPTGGR